MTKRLPRSLLIVSIFFLAAAFGSEALTRNQAQRPRARDLGIVIGYYRTGDDNAITDVPGVRVGQLTLIEGEKVRTGVTAIVPHAGNVFWDKVPAALAVGNGFGKLAGATQIEELGTIETPILLCGTLNVPRVADAVITYMLGLSDMEEVRSINPVVGETNDGRINDIRGRHVGEREVLEAIRSASGGPVAEGTVGAGAGTWALGYKGGIGTSSRRVELRTLDVVTVGVLVQTNFWGNLRINGTEVGREIRERIKRAREEPPRTEGSCMIIVATDAPIEARNLRRLASRALAGMALTGANLSNGSGDYAIAFSTAESVRVHSRDRDVLRTGDHLGNDAMSDLFTAVIDATQEAILNSLLRATDVTGRDGTLYRAIPIDLLVEVGREKGLIEGNPP
ncbi:MAG: P1 family peptidase [bacterium]|nr:P1 family peptidase [bacterium]